MGFSCSFISVSSFQRTLVVPFRMVYITSDGRVVDSRPLSFGSISEFFWGIINFFVIFFRTLFNPVRVFVGPLG